MGIYAKEDLSMIAAADQREPHRSQHYAFDDFQLVIFEYHSGCTRDLTNLREMDSTCYREWDRAKQAYRLNTSKGQMCRLFGRVFN